VNQVTVKSLNTMHSEITVTTKEGVITRHIVNNHGYFPILDWVKYFLEEYK